MNEKEQNAMCALIIRRIEELAKLRDSMATEAAREAINGEIELMQGIIRKLD